MKLSRSAKSFLARLVISPRFSVCSSPENFNACSKIEKFFTRGSPGAAAGSALYRSSLNQLVRIEGASLFCHPGAVKDACDDHVVRRGKRVGVVILEDSEP